MTTSAWILYGAIAATAWFVLAFLVLMFFAGAKRVNGDADE